MSGSALSSLSIQTFPVGAFQCNCTILGDPKTRETLVIDPGDEADKILSALKKENWQVKTLLHTHAHLDHIGASEKLKNELTVKTRLHEGDLLLWQNLPMQGQLFGFQLDPIEDPDLFLKDTEVISVGSYQLEVLHTPGHTPGSCCFLVKQPGEKRAPLLFSGDTLFQRSIGRTDLWGGDFDQIKKSIKERLYTLDPETEVITGHGPSTQIEFEKKENPFVAS